MRINEKDFLMSLIGYVKIGYDVTGHFDVRKLIELIVAVIFTSGLFMDIIERFLRRGRHNSMSIHQKYIAMFHQNEFNLLVMFRFSDQLRVSLNFN